MGMRILSLLVLGIQISVLAKWTYVNKIDEFTDKKICYTEYTDENHRIQLSHEGKSVWMYITRKKNGTFEPNGIIELRVDKNELREIDPIKSKKLASLLGRSTFQWEPSTVGFLLWHGNEKEGLGYIGELLNGREFKARYQLNTMERDAFKISLDGAKESIVKGLELTTYKR